MTIYIINTKTNEFIADNGNLGARFRREPFRKANSEETIQHNIEIEQKLLQKEKEKAIEVRIKELTLKSILGTLIQQDRDGLQLLINSL